MTELLKQKQPEPQTIGMWTTCPDNGHGRSSAWCNSACAIVESRVLGLGSKSLLQPFSIEVCAYDHSRDHRISLGWHSGLPGQGGWEHES